MSKLFLFLFWGFSIVLGVAVTHLAPENGTTRAGQVTGAIVTAMLAWWASNSHARISTYVGERSLPEWLESGSEGRRRVFGYVSVVLLPASFLGIFVLTASTPLDSLNPQTEFSGGYTAATMMALLLHACFVMACGIVGLFLYAERTVIMLMAVSITATSSAGLFYPAIFLAASALMFSGAHMLSRRYPQHPEHCTSRG